MKPSTVITGTSNNGSLEEAIQDAIQKMNHFAGQSGADRIAVGTLASLTVEVGGFTGKNQVTVKFNSHVK